MTLTLTLPDDPASHRWTEEELRLELACTMHAQGRLSKAAGAIMAGIDFFSFQEVLADRGILVHSVSELHEDMAALRERFADVPTLAPNQ